jgi:hypothetical protein
MRCTQEEPRLEATLAGFDIRSPRGAPPPVSRPQCDTLKIRAVCPLCDSLGVKSRKGPAGNGNVRRAPALR